MVFHHDAVFQILLNCEKWNIVQVLLFNSFLLLLSLWFFWVCSGIYKIVDPWKDFFVFIGSSLNQFKFFYAIFNVVIADFTVWFFYYGKGRKWRFYEERSKPKNWMVLKIIVLKKCSYVGWWCWLLFDLHFCVYWGTRKRFFSYSYSVCITYIWHSAILCRTVVLFQVNDSRVANFILLWSFSLPLRKGNGLLSYNHSSGDGWNHRINHQSFFFVLIFFF